MSNFIEKNKPLSVLHTIGEHYLHDSRDFAKRFDLLKAEDLTKTGRIKRFVDLYMAIECALKCHVVLGKIGEDANEVYRIVRNCGHDIGKLSNLASFAHNHKLYKDISDEINRYSVFIRYSLEAHQAFFSLHNDGKSDKRWEEYSRTVSNLNWLNKVRAQLEELIESATPEFTGIVSFDFAKILEVDSQVRQIVLGRGK